MAAPEWQGIRELLDTPEPAQLGPQVRPGVQPQGALDARLKELFGRTKIAPKNQQLIRALVLLWHDHLDAAHMLAQEVENPDGSFVHGIMHRREPDYGNAKYWFRRVGRHVGYPEIAQRVKSLPDGSRLAARLVPNGEWDAMALVDACEAASPDDKLLREIQRIEFEVLLEHLSKA